MFLAYRAICQQAKVSCSQNVRGYVDSANLGLGQACQGNMKHALHLTKLIGV